MTPPEYSVLLLAWDDADPQVAVLGGSALPPTLPLVYQLATQHPVVALYPHLPADENPASTPQEALPAAPAAASTGAPAAPADALATAIAQPGVQLLPASNTGAAAPHAATSRSRIVGLSDLAPAENSTIAAETPAALAAAASKSSTFGVTQSITTSPAAPGRSQWPTGANAPVFTGQAQVPAAPYLGAGSGAFFPPPPPAPPQPAGLKKAVDTQIITTAAATAQPAAPTKPTISKPTPALPPRQNPLAGDLRFDPDPELSAITIQQPALFDERTEEVGAAEANDISAPEDNMVPDAPAAAPPVAPPATPAPAEPLPAPAPHMPKLDGLNFRMIQYARQAAQLVRGGEAFGVIYAPSWPAWLAALEIRNSTRRPLVLYMAALAHDFAGPAERGWLPELERMTLRRATLVLVPDENLRRRLRAHYGEGIGEVRIVAAADETAVQGVLNEVAIG